MTAAPPRYCFLDITIGGKPTERVVLEMYNQELPKTCENFRQLCLGNNNEKVPGTDTPMCYKGSSFHRVIKEFMIQGGDYTNHNGTGGFSIFGAEFKDEAFQYPVDRAGLLCMANRGPNTNGSQFFITAKECPHLTGKHVVFGKVVRGMNTVRKVEHTPVGAQDKPSSPCVIADCGVLEALPDAVAAADGDIDPDWPQDWPSGTPTDNEKLEAAERVRTLGNQLFGKQQFEDAVEKYSKAFRYLDEVIETSAIRATLDEKKLACHSNTAMCFIRLEKWNNALQAANCALRIEPSNAKALFRRATAHIGLQDYDAAKADLTRCKELDPNNADVQTRLQFCVDQQKIQKEKLQANYKKMFA